MSDKDSDFGDLDAELDALDVDTDFSLWSSFRSRKSIASSTGTSDRDVGDLSANPDESLDDPNPLEMNDLEYWRTRIMRDEVFSPKYKPSPQEEAEFMELVKFLGMERKKIFEKEDVKWKELAEQRNIVLKRGPVLCQGQEREFILLTHGFVLAQVEEPTRNAFARMMISRSYEQCDLYTAIEHIRSVPVIVDVVVDVDEDEKEEEGMELEVHAGQVVVRQVVETEEEIGNDVEEQSVSSDEQSTSSADVIKAEENGNDDEEEKVQEEDDDTSEREDVKASSNDEAVEEDESQSSGNDDANLETENSSDDDENIQEENSSVDNNEKKDDDSSGTDDDESSEEEVNEATKSATNKDDTDDAVEGTEEQADAKSEEESKFRSENQGSDESVKEKEETHSEEAPEAPASSPDRRQFLNLFGSKKNVPEEDDGSANCSHEQAEHTAKEEEPAVEKKETVPKPPTSPVSSPDRKQFFSLFGANKAPEKSPVTTPEKAKEQHREPKSPEKPPEKHVKVDTPPKKKKQVTIQEERHCFVIKTEANEFYFECATKQHKEAWLEALERVLVKTRSRVRSNKDRVRGWQHALVQTSLHSASVTGLDDLCCKEWLDERNELDKYNRLSPLHYATMLNMMHIMDWLLRHGADPEVQDEDERTPMYYAQRDQLMGAQSLLLDYGAKRSQLCEVEERGVLFQGAAQVAEAKAAKSASSLNGNKERRTGHDGEVSADDELKSHHQSATKAHGAMNDAMNELRIRGEKINDLAEKANALEENVTAYGDLAKQMKSRAKKKKWYNLK